MNKGEVCQLVKNAMVSNLIIWKRKRRNKLLHVSFNLVYKLLSSLAANLHQKERRKGSMKEAGNGT
jgi:hypothetical protein